MTTAANPVASLWDQLVSALCADAPRAFFGVPADDPELLDAALSARRDVLTFRDQKLAAFAAAGWGMVTGRAAVVPVQAGPSFQNALSGVLECRSIKRPLIVVATANASGTYGRDGFQEFDVTRTRSEYFTWQHHVQDASELSWACRSAIQTSEGVRGGPVLLSLQPEIGSRAVPTAEALPPVRIHGPAPSDAAITEVISLCQASSRTVLLLGAGSRTSDRAQLIALADHLDALVLVTASGRGSFPEGSPRFAGLAGLYATERGRSALASAELVIVLGSGLEETAREGLASVEGRIVQIDTNARVLERSTVVSVGIVADCAVAVRALCSALAEVDRSSPTGRDWGAWQSGSTSDESRAPRYGITAQEFWRELSSVLADARNDDRPFVICQENGLADLWGYDANTFALPEAMRTITPGEQTTMGFGIGAAVGASFAGARVVAICGDGALEQNLSWLLDAAAADTDITLFVLRNGQLGWPSLSRQRGDALTTLSSGGDLVGFARSCGAHAETLAVSEAASQTIRLAIARHGLTVVDVTVSDLDVIPGARAAMEANH